MVLKVSLALVLAVTFHADAQAEEPPAVKPPADVAFAPFSHPAVKTLGPVGPFYPQVAVQRRRHGEAVIECLVAADSALSECKLISESPPKLDFGPAALRMAYKKYIGAPLGTPLNGERQVFRVPFQTNSHKFH